jgi:hypothetical protein
MSLQRKLTAAAMCLALAVGAMISTPQKASAIAPLSFTWSCAPPDGECYFTVTSTNHAKYVWNFGDGTGFGPTTSTSAYRDYAVSSGGQFFTVTLSGYATVGSSSPDNIISCQIEAQGPSPGGNPGAGGTCSG